MTSRRGFTIVELMVAIAVMTILSALVAISFTNTRRNSRDSRRRQDVITISGAMTQLGNTTGTTFVTYNNQPCVFSGSAAENDPSIVSTSPAGTNGCTGANDHAFGKINLKTATSNGYAGNAGRRYAPHSIGEALVKGGYLTTMPQDPSAKVGAVTDATQPDYVLIRACVITGLQQVGTRGVAFGIWAALEGAPTVDETSNSDRYPGGKDAGPAADANGNVYVYDFAAQSTDWDNGSYYNNGVAAGNSVTKVSAVTDCSTANS